MKLAVIGPTYPYKGGISHFTTIFVNQLRKNNTVDFVTWKIQYPKFLYPVDQKDTTSKKTIETKAAYILNFYNPFSWIKSAFHIRHNRPNKLIMTWVTPVQAPIYIVISLYVKMFSKTKIVYLCHNSLPHEPKFYDKFLTKLAFKFGDEFIAHSDEDKKIIRNLSKNKTVIKAFVPVFEDLNIGKIYNKKTIKNELKLNNKVLLFFGFIRPYKGLKYLLNAMPDIIKYYPDISLLVVGEFWSKDKEKYIYLVNKLNLNNYVIFIDEYVPNEDVGMYFSVADVTVCPYLSATQSAIVQTAYAFNKPVIATNVGGLPDVVIPYESGLLVPPKNAKSIAHAVDEYYSHPIPESNVLKVKDKFSWPQYIKLTEGI
jgi:glycosyltransferase involved in cell wall biosynthesis